MSSRRLNAGQRAAVDCDATRVVVSAGAGSGKTLVLAERFCDRITELDGSGVPQPMNAVLLITFTDKAAGELVERVRDVLLSRGREDLARQVDGAWISTIHGFCARMVRRHAIELGVDPAFTVVADPEITLVRRRAFEDAAVAAAGSDARIERLIEEHGVESVRNATMATYDTLRSKGLGVDALQPAPRTALNASIDACRGGLGPMTEAYVGLGSSATIAKNAEGYRRCLDLLASFEGGAGDPLPAELLELEGCLGSRLGSAEVKSATTEANETILGLLGDAVAEIAAEQADALTALCVAYAQRYDSMKGAAGCLDFEDLQLLTRRLWLESPEAAERYARQFVEVLVDEFQDTTALQLQAIEPVATRRLCLVGDAQQSIYRFRDADVGVFTGQRSLASAVGGERDLKVNYRSHPLLLSALNELFGSPALAAEGLLRLDPGGDGKDPLCWPVGEPRVEVLLADRSACETGTWRELEADMLASRLRRIVDDGVARPGDIAVLVRSTKTMPPYLEALERHGFDVSTSDASGFYLTPELAAVRWLLRVLANPLDDEAVVGLLAGTFGGLGDGAIGLLADTGAGVWEALAHREELGLSPDAVARTTYVRVVVAGLRERLGRVRLSDVVLDAAEALGVEAAPARGGAAWANVRKAARLAAEFERTRSSDPRALLEYLDEREAYVRREPAAAVCAEGLDTLRVMTVHAAKGLEFPIVAVADLGHDGVTGASRFLLSQGPDGLRLVARPAVCGTQTKLPDPGAWARARELDRELELAESKRVLYVACTRAEQLLVLAGSSDLSRPPSVGRAIDWVRSAVERPGGVTGIVTRLDGDSALVTAEPARQAACFAPGCERTSVGLPALPPEPLPPVRELSYTTLSLYERCAYRFYAEKMLGFLGARHRELDDPRALGSALHAALEAIANGHEVDASRLHALGAFNGLGPRGLARLAAAVEAVRCSPLAALLRCGQPEVPFAVRLEGGILKGTLDLLVRDGTSALVLDYKTGDKAGQEGDHRRQAEAYSLALLQAGSTRVEVRFVEVERGGATASFSFAGQDRGRLEARIEGVFAGIESGAFERLAAFDASVCPDCAVSGTLCPIVHAGVAGGRQARRSRKGCRD